VDFSLLENGLGQPDPGARALVSVDSGPGFWIEVTKFREVPGEGEVFMFAPENPLIVQSDRSLLLEVHSPRYEVARDALVRFAELEKSPEHVHTYRITPLSLWNAAAAGLSAEEVGESIRALSKYDPPQNVLIDIGELMGRFGKIRLLKDSPLYRLEVDDAQVATQLRTQTSLKGLLEVRDGAFWVSPLLRGTLKQRLARLGYPVDDRVGFEEGERLELALKSETGQGFPFALRPYQRKSVEAFLGVGLSHGVIVLPCGAGKTVVGMGVMTGVQGATLILCTNITAARQWKDELLDKTTLAPEQIGEYNGQRKEIRPVTVATYSIMTRRRGEEYPHLALFSSREWGLIIYDEVHLLPAPVFRITAEIQSRRRLGLTATLVREDGRETDVFSLIGPKRYDVPWREMEQTGYIAEALCTEIRVGMSEQLKIACAAAEDGHEQFRLAAENPAKDPVVQELLERHADESVLVIGQYIDQLERLSVRLGAPLITGKTPEGERQKLYGGFRRGEIRRLVVSKVANFSIDLPDASVCVQVSGTFGSRQEEAQRLGRILRPKKRQASFYSLVSAQSAELGFAMNRQLFLTEQGYRYYIEDRVSRTSVIPLPAAAPAAMTAAPADSAGALARVLRFPRGGT